MSSNPDWISVIAMLLDGNLPVEGIWYGVDEDYCPKYKGRELTRDEQCALDMVAESRI